MHMHTKTELQRVEHSYWHDLSMPALYQSHMLSQVLHTYDATNAHDLKTNHYQNTVAAERRAKISNSHFSNEVKLLL